ncbi:hypothetical protein ACFL6S_24310 [Candidatus Poribacteria bacterium]
MTNGTGGVVPPEEIRRPESCGESRETEKYGTMTYQPTIQHSQYFVDPKTRARYYSAITNVTDGINIHTGTNP